MRVLLTGNRGYIGVVLASMLEQAGHDVLGLDSDLFEYCDFGAPAKQIPTIRKDVRDVDPKDLEGFEAVLHLAGISNDPLGDMNPAWTYEINHQASVHLRGLRSRWECRVSFSLRHAAPTARPETKCSTRWRHLTQ